MIGRFNQNFINLASDRLGAKAIYATDDFFADKQRMLHDTDPVFIDGKFDDNGKWMDGWESRRKRTEGHDYCDIELARPGVIHGVVVDTTHFTGNYPPQISLEGCYSDSAPDENTQWTSLIEVSDIVGDERESFNVKNTNLFTHVRLHIYPDGGIARLKIYGEPQCNWDKLEVGEVRDLGAALNGGRAIACSDEHFGIMGNILLPGKGINMGDGWETARRRGPGHDWVVIALGHAGTLNKITVDTAFFKGNYPNHCTIQAANLTETPKDIGKASESWAELLPKQKLEMDIEHHFTDQINDLGTISHVRLNIFPDGGISRLRLYGTIR